MIYEFWYERLTPELAYKHYLHIPGFLRRIDTEISLCEGKQWTLWFFRDLRYYYKDMDKMPKKGRQNATGDSAKRNARKETVWANIQLTRADDGPIEELLGNLLDLYGELGVLYENGADINLTYKPTTDSYVAMLFIDAHDTEDKRIGLSAWSDDPHGATAALVYKFVAIAQRDLAPYVSSNTDRRFR